MRVFVHELGDEKRVRDVLMVDRAGKILDVVASLGYKRDGVRLGSHEGSAFSVYEQKGGSQYLLYVMAFSCVHLLPVSDVLMILHYVERRGELLERLRDSEGETRLLVG